MYLDDLRPSGGIRTLLAPPEYSHRLLAAGVSGRDGKGPPERFMM